MGVPIFLPIFLSGYGRIDGCPHFLSVSKISRIEPIFEHLHQNSPAGIISPSRRLSAVLRKFKSGCIQAQMGSANEDKRVAVARRPCFPSCSIILPREECRPCWKDPHQSCPGNSNRTRERQCRRAAGNSIGPESLSRFEILLHAPACGAACTAA